MLKNLLENNRAAVLKRYKGLVMETYPADSQGFLKRETNRFANPVGATISREIETIFSALIGDKDSGDLACSLEKIIKIRAVQEFSPSQAVCFVFLLKKAIREELGDAIREEGLQEDLLELESQIDDIALLAFDSYMKCREKIYEIRANETRNRSRILLERMNRISSNRECGCDLNNGVACDGNDKER